MQIGDNCDFLLFFVFIQDYTDDTDFVFPDF